MSDTAKRLSPLDMMFLYGETPSTMMHVGGLMPFTPSPDAPPDFLRRLLDETKHDKVQPPWNCKLAHPTLLYRPDQAWVVDKEFDLDYHVRRSALASPGDERELGILVSRLHSNALDLSRPPWEVHFIEGLEGGRFALYMKMHHSLVDGYTAMKILGKSMSTDPNNTDHKLFWNVRGPATPAPKKTVAEGNGGRSIFSPVADAISGVGSAIGFVAGTGRSAYDLTRVLINTELRPSDE